MNDNKAWTLLTGLGLGAGLMYLLDPGAGRRRRHEIADKARSAALETRTAAGRKSRDLANRAHGLIARVQHYFHHHEAVPNAALEARVRSRLGHIVSHPHAIHVDVDRAQVTLSGPILTEESDPLIRAVAAVPGVEAVVNDLELHDDPTGVPALQGGIVRTTDPAEDDWMTSSRVAAAVAGGALALLGLTRRGPVGTLLAGGGLALAARGLAPRPLRRLARPRSHGEHVVSVHKTLDVGAPVEHVFDTWAHYENFPLVLSALRDVQDLGDGRSHWVAEGPAGVPVSWDAELTAFEPFERLAWRSLPGSAVDNAGTVSFRPTDTGTQVEIQLSYNPPGGPLGHLVARLFGADPESRMDDDLRRMKAFLETGERPGAPEVDHPGPTA
jgi:uncharacterized membrane protein